MSDYKQLLDKCEELEELISCIDNRVVERRVFNITDTTKPTVTYDYTLSMKSGALDVEVYSSSMDSINLITVCGKVESVTSGNVIYKTIGEFLSGDYELRLIIANEAVDSNQVSAIVAISAPKLIIVDQEEV